MNSPTPSQLLRDDHKKIRGLFIQVEANLLRSAENLTAALNDLQIEINAHSRVEEEVLYPILLSIGPDPMKLWIEEGLRNHEDLAQLMSGLTPQSVDLQDRIRVARDLLEPHMASEEVDILPQVDAILGDRLDEVCQRMNEMRAENAPGIQAPHGGEQMRKTG